MADEAPEHWHAFLRIYGHAVFMAHQLEKHLGTLLWVHDARKRNVVRRPRESELLALIDELDGNTLGGLIERLHEYQIDHAIMDLFVRANDCRIDLVHHFTVKFETEVTDGSDFSEAVRRVEELREPILLARAEAERLASLEIKRMQADVEREREERGDPFRFLLDPELNRTDEGEDEEADKA